MTGTDTPTAGQVLISEVMYNPSGAEPDNEWLEVTNVTTASKNLSGLVLKDGGSHTHTISGSVVVAPGAYVVLARSRAAAVAAKVPTASIVYEYGGTVATAGIQLGNGTTGAIGLYNGTTLIGGANYGALLSSASAQSIELKTLTAAASTTAAGWCLAHATWVTGSDKGTPGAANDCP